MVKVTSRTAGEPYRVGLPALTLLHFSHLTVVELLSKIDCRTIGLKEVEWECNDLGKNSHFWERFVFVSMFVLGWKKAQQKENYISILSYRDYVILVTPPSI